MLVCSVSVQVSGITVQIWSCVGHCTVSVFRFGDLVSFLLYRFRFLDLVLVVQYRCLGLVSGMHRWCLEYGFSRGVVAGQLPLCSVIEVETDWLCCIPAWIKRSDSAAVFCFLLTLWKECCLSTSPILSLSLSQKFLNLIKHLTCKSHLLLTSFHSLPFDRFLMAGHGVVT